MQDGAVNLARALLGKMATLANANMNPMIFLTQVVIAHDQLSELVRHRQK